MLHAALTPTQQTAVATRFCDSFFGTDPAGYDYELGARGEITGRKPLQMNKQAATRHYTIRSTRASLPGDPIIMDAVCTELARMIQQAGRPGDAPGGMQGHAASLLFISSGD